MLAATAFAANLSCAAGATGIATARMGAAIETPVILVNSADMDFGKIAQANTAGTVIMTPGASSTCSTSGGLIQSGNCHAATFEGQVRFLFALQITPPAGNSISLSGPGGATMVLDNFVFRPGSGLLGLTATRFLILNLDGSYTFYAGGTLHVGANQAPGIYNGAFQILLNYN